MDIDMTWFRHRIEVLRRQHEMSARALSLKIGQNPAYIQQLESGMRNKKPPGYPVLKAIADTFNMTVDELLYGNNDSLPTAPKVNLTMLLHRIGAEPVPPDEASIIEDFAVSAGPGEGIPQGFDDTVPRQQRRKKQKPGRHRLRVRGRCMEPLIREGDVLVFDTRRHAEPGDIVVGVLDEEHAIVKLLIERDGRRCLESLDGQTIELNERVRIVGVAIAGQYRLL